MFANSRKEKLVGHAQELAHDLSEAIAPHVERARDELGPRLSDARNQVAPRLVDAREAIAPRLADAREQLSPIAEDARDRITKGAAAAAAAAAPIAVEARRRGVLATAALKGEPVKQKSGKKKYFLLAGLLGLAAVAFKKLRGGDESANWQTSYAPTPAPAAAPTPTTGTHVASPVTDTADDTAGGTPGEVLSDAAETPHAVTTPDAPAESIDVTLVEDPDKA